MKLGSATLRIFVVVVTGLIVGSWDRADSVFTQAATEQTNKARAGVCEREAEKLLGQKAIRIGGSIRTPKKLRDVLPNYPELPPGTRVGASGIWLGEALINTSGKVTRVWPIREVVFKPAFPSFNNAIVDAIRLWEFEPVLLNGMPTPFCMTVSVNIHWK